MRDAESSPSTRQDLQRRAALGVAWTLLATAVTIPAGFAANVVLARMLGVEGYGRLAFLTAALELVVAVVDLGTTAAVVQFGSRAHAVGDQDRVRAILSRAQGFRLLVVAPVLSGALLLLLDVPLPLLVAGLALGVWVPAALAGINDCLTLENRSDTAAKVHVVASVVSQLVVVGVAFLSRDADTTWLSRLAFTAVAPAAALPLIASGYRSAVLRPRLPRQLPAGFWQFALPTAAAGIVGGLVVSRSEVLLLEWLKSGAAVGIFALAFGIAAHVFGPAGALTNPLLPAVSSLRAVDAPAVRAAFLRVTRVSVVMTTALLVLAVPTLALLTESIYGDEYRDAAPLLTFLATGVAASTLGGPVSAFNLSGLRSMRVLVASLWSLVVDLALALALIPIIGVWGAAVAAVGASVVRVIILVQDELGRLPLPWKAIRPQAVLFTASSAAAVGVWWVSSQATSPAVGVALALTLGAMVWCVLVRLCGAMLEEGDRRQVAAVFPPRARLLSSRLLAPVTRS